MTTRPATVLAACLLAAAAPARAQSPWLAAEARLEHDTQGRTALAVDAQRGTFLTPRLTAALLLGGSRATGGALATTTGSAGVGFSLGIPEVRLGLDAQVRALAGAPSSDGIVPMYAVGAALNAGAGISLRGRAHRERYTATLASLDSTVLVNTWELALDRAAAPGWAGEVVSRAQSYGDGNQVRTAYGWVLAPLSRSAGHSLRAGYAAAWQDADHSRWVADRRPLQGPPQREVPGRYAPYYTPSEVATHSVLANGALALGSAWLMADASIGIRATEMAPVLVAGTGAGGTASLSFYERSFTPYRGALSLVLPLDGRTSLTTATELTRTTYYRWGQLRLAVARSL
jgi:hypothetical protein